MNGPLDWFKPKTEKEKNRELIEKKKKLYGELIKRSDKPETEPEMQTRVLAYKQVGVNKLGIPVFEKDGKQINGWVYHIKLYQAQIGILERQQMQLLTQGDPVTQESISKYDAFLAETKREAFKAENDDNARLTQSGSITANLATYLQERKKLGKSPQLGPQARRAAWLDNQIALEKAKFTTVPAAATVNGQKIPKGKIFWYSTLSDYEKKTNQKVLDAKEIIGEIELAKAKFKTEKLDPIEQRLEKNREFLALWLDGLQGN